MYVSRVLRKFAGREMDSTIENNASSSLEKENRPGILVVGSPNVGKRTVISRLLGVNFEEVPDSSAELLCHGWTINTKYYSADVSVWMAQLDDGFSLETQPMANKLAALVMVFDTSDMESFMALQKWVSQTDIKNFDILLCMGNKADLLPGHFAHTAYKRVLQKDWVSFGDPDPEFLEYGNLETEGSSLLGGEEPSWELKRSCVEWCIQQNIEYVEACASNEAFDKCLSVDGDVQGVDRLYGALSAHMWPGMVLKSGNKIAEPYQPEREEELSEEESDYELEYEILSEGSAEPWDDTEEWVSADGASTSSDNRSALTMNATVNGESEDHKKDDNAGNMQPSTSKAPGPECESNGNAVNVQHSASRDPIPGNSDGEVIAKENKLVEAIKLDGDTSLGFEDLEQLMNEIGNVRDNLRLMPDFQRREMAARLAVKMANMFGDSSSADEDELK